MNEKLDTVIVGGGQGGLSLSYYLTQQGREHIVLEKASQPGEAWRNQRWDSFTLVTPNWCFGLPGGEYHDNAPDAYMPKAEILQRFERYTTRYRLPVRYNTEVRKVERLVNGARFRVDAGAQTYTAQNVVVATGLFQQDKIPPFAAQIAPEILQLGSSQYRNPAALPPGAVIVVGSGQSGCQIAEELFESGRKVFLSTGTAGRFPRRYRGKDGFYWINAIGYLDRTADKLPSPRARFAGNPHLTGKNGGHDLNLHKFYRDGIILLGHLRGFEDGNLIVAPDLKDNLLKVDQMAANLLKMVDGHILQNGIEAPEEKIALLEDGYAAPDILSIDLRQEKIAVIIWAVGLSFDFSMVCCAAFDDFGFPIAERGVTRFPGLYFLGMPWLHTQKSGLLMGIKDDAAYLAERIKTG